MSFHEPSNISFHLSTEQAKYSEMPSPQSFHFYFSSGLSNMTFTNRRSMQSGRWLQNQKSNMYPILLLISIPLFIELWRVIQWLENHNYIEWSYQHSIQHFAYLCIYWIWLVLLWLWIQEHWFFMLSIGTLVFLWHIRNERKNLLK